MPNIMTDNLFWLLIAILIFARWLISDAIDAWSANKESEREHELAMWRLEHEVSDDE